MSFRRAARAAFAAGNRAYWILLAVTAVLTSFLASCGGSSHSSSASHNAYVTLPNKGSVALLHINNSTGAISLGAETPQVLGTIPTPLALDPGKKFLYVGNAEPKVHSLSIFNIASDGTLTQTIPAPDIVDSPRAMAIDASGKYLLITTNFVGANLRVYALDSGTGKPTFLNSYVANSSPNNLTISPSSNFVYVANEDVSLITGFSLDSSTGNLTPIPGSPFPARPGVAGMAIDPASHYLYAANSTDNSVSAFTIDSNNGSLTQILGSPYPMLTLTSPNPRSLTTDTTGKFLYVANQETNNVLGFQIAADTGQLTVINSGTPFSTGTAPIFILADPDGQHLYVGNQSSTNITGFTYDTTTGKLTAITGSPFTVGATPGEMVISH